MECRHLGEVKLESTFLYTSLHSTLTMRFFVAETPARGKQTKNPPRQKALTRQNTLPDKRPSTVWTIFYESEEVEGLLSVSSDKRPSYVGETKGPPFSYWKQEGLLSLVLRRAFCQSARTKDPPPFQKNNS